MYQLKTQVMGKKVYLSVIKTPFEVLTPVNFVQWGVVWESNKWNFSWTW